MAARKSTTKKASSTTRAGTKKAGTKRSAGSVSTATASKSGTPKSSAKKSAPTAKKATTTKKAAPGVKLTDKQRDMLRNVQGSGATGYTAGQKIEERSLEALREKKLIKRNAKDKATGKHSYSITKTGEKQLTTAPAGGTSTGS